MSKDEEMLDVEFLHTLESGNPANPPKPGFRLFAALRPE
jgi:hypothetical protein